MLLEASKEKTDVARLNEKDRRHHLVGLEPVQGRLPPKAILAAGLAGSARLWFSLNAALSQGSLNEGRRRLKSRMVLVGASSMSERQPHGPAVFQSGAFQARPPRRRATVIPAQQ